MKPPSYLSKPNAPPHHQGQLAAWQGQPETANPYDPAEHSEPDDYPGRYQQWRWGWLHAMAIIEHSRKPS